MMHRCFRWPACQTLRALIAACSVIYALPAFSAVDGLDVARAQRATSLQWHNVEGKNNWVSGPLPTRDSTSGLFSIDLDDGRQASIHVPAHAQLRIMGLQDLSVEPKVAVSQGTGLSIGIRPVRANDGRSWLVRTNLSQPAVIHLSGHAQSTHSQRYALFLAEIITHPEAVVYRQELTLPGQRVNVRRADEAVGMDHVRVAAGASLSAAVRGPQRLLFEYQLDSELQQRNVLVTVALKMSGQEVRNIRQLTGPEGVVPVQIDADWRHASRRERLTIDVPQGEHEVALTPSHSVLVRAATSGESDLLLPQANLPMYWRQVEPDLAIERTEQSALEGAESNEWRDSGAVAGHHLIEQARQRPGLGGMRASADELVGQFTQFQDLVPSKASASQLRKVILRRPTPPQRQALHRVVSGMARLQAEELPAARFHRLGAMPLQFESPQVSYPLRVRVMVPANSSPIRLELRQGEGTYTLESGAPRLADEKLQLTAPVASLLGADWGTATIESTKTAPPLHALIETAAVEWQLPVGSKEFSLRSLNGEIEVAVQWAASIEYFLDDAFLAQLHALGSPTIAPGTQTESALRPLRRMLDAARAQFIANTEPAQPGYLGSDESAAGRIAAALVSEAEPARAVELWAQALQVSQPEGRASALRGLARALLAASDRFGAERLLRSHWVGTDTALSQTAEEELTALYASESDWATELLFASAIAAKDRTSYTRLSQLLAAAGDDRTALLAGIASQPRDIPALLQSALRIGYWKTYDALLEHLPPGSDRREWEAHRAIWHRNEELADTLFGQATATDWVQALRDGRYLASKLRTTETDRSGSVARWLQWQDQHPGPRGWQPNHAAVVSHGGGLNLRSVALNLRSQWWRADAQQPLVTRIVGPARVRFEARPLHPTGVSALDGWIHVRAEGQLWVMPFRGNQASPGLTSETGSDTPGAAIVREIDLPAGLHELKLDAGGVPLAARVLQRRALLQLPVLPALTSAHFEPQSGVIGRPLYVPRCDGLKDCAVMVEDGDLVPLKIQFETFAWSGLPKPPAQVDAGALRLSTGDTDGALALATDPHERMRLLLWLVHSDPAARPRALAMGAELASRHPTAEIRSHWEALSAASGWVLSPLVDRSAGLRRVPSTAGLAESPVARIRAAMLPTVNPGELRLLGDSRASFVSEQTNGFSLGIELTLDAWPGMPTLPLTAVVERNGQPWRTFELTQLERTSSVDVQIPAGKQTLSVSLQKPFANQSLRVRFKGPIEPESTTRDWHIATRADPVRLTVAGPVIVRIDRLDSDGVRSEERLIKEQISTLVLPPRSGVTESLYRIYRRVLQPGEPSAPLERPNNYLPEPMVTAPAPFNGPSPQQIMEVSFIDGIPLRARPDYTNTVRSGLQRRRDTDGAGGGATGALMERYAETGFGLRRGSEDGTQWTHIDGLLRLPARGSPVLGLRWATERSVEWSTERPWPFSVQGSLDAYLQSTPQGLGTSITARASASQTRTLGSNWSHTPSFGAVARWTSLNTVSDTQRVDTDVFTRYRASHPLALVIGETLSWRPWRDSHFSGHLNLITNPELNPLRPDQINTSVLWRQLVGNTRVEAGVRATRYFSDARRVQGTVTRQWHLSTGTDLWFADGSRLEMVTNLSRDPAQPGFWGGVEFRWHWSAGRRLSDFAPNELDFRSLRTWRAPTTHNRIEDRR